MKKCQLIIFLILISLTNSIIAKQLQPDSLKVISSWRFNEDKSFSNQINIDTALYDFQNYNPIFQNDISSTYLGNYGLPGISHVFRKSYNYSEFILFRGYENYFHDAGTTVFYNTKRPYTNLIYSGGGSDDNSGQNIKLIHTQNINRYINTGIKYDLISSAGHYKRQKVKNHSFSIFLSYIKDRYNLYTAFSINKFKIEENGGLQDDEDISSSYSSSTLPVNLDQAESILRNNSFSLTQEYLIGEGNLEESNDSLNADSVNLSVYNKASELRFIHDFYYNSSYRIFDDQNPQSGFYRNIYIDEQSTFDSVKYRNIYNTFQLVKEKELLGINNLGGKFLIGSKFLKNYFNQKDTSFWDNYLVMGLFDKSEENINWKFHSKYFFTGYKAGDYNLRLNITANLGGLLGENKTGIKASIGRKQADYILTVYQSNHFSWENDFTKENSSEIELFYNNDQWKFNTSLIYTAVNNYIYFDSTAIPVQFDGSVSVVSINIKKNFQFGKWDFNNEIIFQHTNNKDVVRIPSLSTSSQISREGSLFKSALKTRIGLQMHYNTAFYAYAYMPATGQFYIQDNKQLGNYPYMDIFLNLKVKRTRFFLIYEHFNSWFMKDNYFYALHYPMKSAFFKFGLSWSFYD